MELYQVAFFQWRMIHPHPKLTKMDEVHELIEDRIEYTFKRYQVISENDSFGTDASMDIHQTSFDI